MKRVQKSKTISLNGLGLLGLFVPHFDAWVLSHPKQIIGGVFLLNIALRFFTKDKVQIELPGVLKKMTKLYRPMLLVLILLCLGMNQCAQFPIDPAMAAADGNDYVVVLQGLGQKSTKGYLFAQVRVGAATTGVISAVFPDTNCKRESCAKYQFFRKDGSPGFVGAVPKGQTISQFKLSDVLGHDGLVVAADEGEYSVLSQVYYIDQAGQEHSTVGSGFVRVNVLNAQYQAVACDDPNIAWKGATPDNCEAQFTTAFRSVVCGGCQ